MQAFTDKSMEFQTKIIERSGLGDETYLPDGKPAANLRDFSSPVAMHPVSR